MSLRRSLSPNQKFSIIVASIAILMAAETGGLFVLSQRYPAHPEPLAPASPSPGALAQLPEKPQSAPPQVFTVPGAQPPASNGAPNAAQNPLVPPISPVLGGTANTAKNNLAPKPGVKESPEKAEARAAFDAGVKALKNKDGKTAIDSFERVVALVPDNLPSHLNLASLYLESQQPQKALPHLQKAALLDPQSAAVRFNMARTLLALRRPDDAIKSLRETVRLAPTERESRLLLAQVLTQTRKPKEAYPHWTYLAEHNKADVEAHMTAAAIANDVLNQPKTAEKWLREGIQASPRSPELGLMLGRLLLGSNQFKAAIGVLTTASKARPDVFEFYPLLANARAATGDTKGAIGALQSALLRLPVGKNADEKKRIAFVEGGLRISLGQVQGNAKHPKEALAEFQKAARLRPTDPQPLSLGALASLQLKNKPEAIRQLQAALRLNEKNLDDRKLLAQLLADSRRLKEADAQLALYTRSRPRDVEALLLWAQVAKAANDSKREKQVVQQITQVAPTNPIGWAQLGVLQREAGNKKAALATFTKLAALTPKDPSPPFEMARLQASLGDFDGAFASWQKVVRNKPDYAPSYSSLLQAGDEAGERSAARAFMVRQLSGRGENVKALNEVLGFYESKKRPDEAKAFLNDLLARNPKFIATKAALDAYSTPSGEKDGADKSEADKPDSAKPDNEKSEEKKGAEAGDAKPDAPKPADKSNE